MAATHVRNFVSRNVQILGNAGVFQQTRCLSTTYKHLFVTNTGASTCLKSLNSSINNRIGLPLNQAQTCWTDEKPREPWGNSGFANRKEEVVDLPDNCEERYPRIKGFLIGRGGMTIQRLRMIIDCEIDLPKGADQVIVSASDPEKLKKGAEHIRDLVKMKIAIEDGSDELIVDQVPLRPEVAGRCKGIIIGFEGGNINHIRLSRCVEIQFTGENEEEFCEIRGANQELINLAKEDVTNLMERIRSY